MSHTGRPRIVYTDHSELTEEDFTAFESLMAAQRIARGSGHDANWDLILTEEGSDRNGWLHTTGVFRPAPEERLTRPVPLGYVEMEFSRDGKALPDIPAGADRQRTTVALARSTGGRHGAGAEAAPAAPATAPAVRRTR
ncbi:hypothetical protein OG196_24300 [Kitasatospora purpeofusca]|uniref:hypothetical protein n=1 Tax=Kitasatospora purpeofusca TaxID=67352 RepID=UPI002E12B915|nr:hypothetical protein OG196_24300 [Kitasatospora purpeofusca]